MCLRMGVAIHEALRRALSRFGSAARVDDAVAAEAEQYPVRVSSRTVATEA